MLINQIAVFLENRQGRLHSLVKSISNAGVNIQSLNIADTSDFGIVRMVTSDNEKALKIIEKAGFTSSTIDLVGFEVEDKPGSLASVLQVLDKNGVSIEYIYTYSCSVGKMLMLIKTSDIETAQSVLEKHNM